MHINLCVFPVVIVFGFAVVLLYEFGWRLFENSAFCRKFCKENGAIPLCELLTGFFIGLLIIIGGLYAP